MEREERGLLTLLCVLELIRLIKPGRRLSGATLLLLGDILVMV